MGYLNKSEQTVTAHFTKYGRELLARCMTGQSGPLDEQDSPEYVITQFALGDDEIDYSLWDESELANLKGRVIENMALIESTMNRQEIMNFKLIPESTGMQVGAILGEVPSSVLLVGEDDHIDIIPVTQNAEYTEEYKFYLEHDTVIDMRMPWNAPKHQPGNFESVVDTVNRAITFTWDFPMPLTPEFYSTGGENYYNFYKDGNYIVTPGPLYSNNGTEGWPGFVVTFEWLELQWGNSYEFYVTARNKDGEGPISNIVTVELPHLPGMPSGLSANMSQVSYNGGDGNGGNGNGGNGDGGNGNGDEGPPGGGGGSGWTPPGNPTNGQIWFDPNGVRHRYIEGEGWDPPAL